MRNATCLSIAPTGTLSIIAGTSAGIEPLFALAYRRAHGLDGEPLVELNPVFRRWAEREHVDADAVLRHVAATGTLAGAPDVTAAAHAVFMTATELSVDQHLAMQHAVQRHVDNGVSKTINLRADAGLETVAHAYREGWRLGLKGVTIYRRGSRPDEVFMLGAGEDWTIAEFFAKCDPGACRL